MIDKLRHIEQTFSTVKQVGDDGAALAKLTYKTIENMELVCKLFEEGMNSETWSTNFSMFAGEENMQTAMLIYQTFKETLTKLGEIE